MASYLPGDELRGEIREISHASVCSRQIFRLFLFVLKPISKPIHSSLLRGITLPRLLQNMLAVRNISQIHTLVL